MPDAVETYRAIAEAYPKASTRQNYLNFVSAFAKVAPEGLDVADVDASTVSQFEQSLAGQEKSLTYISLMMQYFRALHNKAVRAGIAAKSDAFAGVCKRRPKAAEAMRADVAVRSGRCAAGAETHWHALRLFAPLATVEKMIQESCQCRLFYPLITTTGEGAGGAVARRVPLMRRTLFVRCGSREETRLASLLAGHASWYSSGGKASVIPDQEMELFMKVIEAGLALEESDAACYRQGMRVEITGGPLAGHRGVVSHAPDGDSHISLMVLDSCFRISTEVPPHWLRPEAETSFKTIQ